MSPLEYLGDMVRCGVHTAVQLALHDEHVTEKLLATVFLSTKEKFAFDNTVVYSFFCNICIAEHRPRFEIA